LNLVLDTGALIALERDDRRVAGLIRFGRRAGSRLISVPEVVGQVWRGSPRQVHLARLLPGLSVVDVSVAEGRLAGELLAQSGTTDVVDALLVLRILPGDQVLTSDPDDIGRLLATRGVAATVLPV
jgi:hypothetical protein